MYITIACTFTCCGYTYLDVSMQMSLLDIAATFALLNIAFGFDTDIDIDTA